MARKSSGGGGLLFLVIIVAGVVAQFGKEVLIAGGVILVLWIVVKLFSTTHSKSAQPQPRPVSTGYQRASSRAIPSREVPRGRTTSSDGDQFWQVPTIDGTVLRGPIYMGSGLASVSGAGIEPALVDLSLRRDKSVVGSKERYLSYWPSYSGASPQARQAYVNWLKSGMEDPEADIGYVFLYFYGLERRALHDARQSEVARSSLSLIESEIERLLARYGSNRSFRSYAESLLDLIKHVSVDPRLYDRPAPKAREWWQLTFADKIALGQCAADGKPLPADWAFVWFMGSPEISLKKPARRCADQFQELFLGLYREKFGEGMRLSPNRTTLVLDRRPASATFGTYDFKSHSLKFNLPDVTVLTAPVKQLQEIADRVCERLDGYSRFIAKNPQSAGSLESIVELPVALWPKELSARLLEVRALVGGSQKPLAIAFEKIKAWFPPGDSLNKGRYQALCRALGEIGLGIEPDPRYGGAVPAVDSTVVLFADESSSSAKTISPQYGAASLSIHLASCVATADGEASDLERSVLTRRLDESLQLTASERQRLKALARLHLANPPKLAGLKSRVEDLSAEQKAAMGEFLVAVACADAIVDPKEVSILEKIYKLLGLDLKELYAGLHVVATEPVSVRPAATGDTRKIPAPARPASTSEVQLDLDKVAALKRDSERISAVLATIFTQPSTEQPEEHAHAAESEVKPDALLGLDPAHSAFVRTLLTRMSWSRADLEELAADRGLMLDGALERINEGAYDRFDKPLFEGDDPVELDGEVIEEIVACRESDSANATL